jgi:preprotein translocase subunit SecD
METSDIFKNWRIVLVIVCIAASLWFIAPHVGPSGWTTNIQKGFDIEGGARAVLVPDNSDRALIQDTMEILRSRMNVYGLRDIRVSTVSDLTGKTYILVEAAGLTEDDVRQVVATQGLFEAKIGNETIFTGTDIVVDSYKNSIQPVTGGGYQFSIATRIVNPDASQKFATVTNRLTTDFTGVTSAADSYLNETLDLYIDNKLVDSLKIASNLKGRVFDTPAVQGGAADRASALTKMNQMKAILQSGSLPMKLEVSSLDTVSPALGGMLLQNVMLAGAAAIAAVGVVIFLRYRSPKMTGLIMATVFTEALIVLGVSVAINWQLDLAAIAGIIVSLGTGVNQEIIMTDEYLFYGKEKRRLSFKEQIKEASFIIFAAFGSGIAAMLPLIFIGLGQVRGFAITTLIGMTGGVFITRPAFLVMMEAISDEKAKPEDEPKTKPEPPKDEAKAEPKGEHHESAERPEGHHHEGHKPSEEPPAA